MLNFFIPTLVCRVERILSYRLRELRTKECWMTKGGALVTLGICTLFIRYRLLRRTALIR